MPPCPQATCRGFPRFSRLLGPPPSGQSMGHRAAHSMSQGTAPPSSWRLNLGGARPAAGLARPRHLHLALRSPWPQLVSVGFWPSGLSPLAVLPRGSETDGDSPAGSLSGPPRSRVHATRRTPCFPAVVRLPAPSLPAPQRSCLHVGPGRDLPAPAPSRQSSAPSCLSPSVCSAFPSLLSPLFAALSPGPQPPGSSRREPRPRLRTYPCAVSSRNTRRAPPQGQGSAHLVAGGL